MMKEVVFNLLSTTFQYERKFKATDTIFSVIEDPVFKSFGKFLFPIGYRSIDDGWTLKDVSRLLPYHSNISVEETQNVLNYFHKEAQERPVFYDIYTEEEKRKDRSKKVRADLFELLPAEPYSSCDLNWRDEGSRVNENTVTSWLDDLNL